MILLDHNITKEQAETLRRLRVHFQQIGYDVGRPEWDDQQEILRYLHRVKQPTLFTWDHGLFRRHLCHPNYCIVVITGPVLETASMIRKFLRHPQFKTKAKRQGKVVELSPAGITWWEFGRTYQQQPAW